MIVPASAAINRLIELIKNRFDSLSRVASTGSYYDLSDTPDIGNIVLRETVIIGTDAPAGSTVPAPVWATDSNALAVYQDGLLLTPGVHYTLSPSTGVITLLDTVSEVGNIFTFVLSSESGAISQLSSSIVTFSDTTEDQCYGGDCQNVNDALLRAPEAITTKAVTSAYPVGSIYMSVTSTSPASLFGGTWEQLKDRFLLGAGDEYENATTGGQSGHFLVPNNLSGSMISMAQNKTGAGVTMSGVSTSSITYQNSAWATASVTNLRNKGLLDATASPIPTMPPYLTVYMWKRVS